MVIFEAKYQEHLRRLAESRFRLKATANKPGRSCSSDKIKAVGVHHLAPGCSKITHELFL
jgi:hypothetical protein